MSKDDRLLGKREREAVVACVGCHFTGVTKDGTPILARLILNDLYTLMRRDGWTIEDIQAYREDMQDSLREITTLRALKLISAQQAKEILEAVWDLPYLSVIDVILDRDMLVDVDNSAIDIAVQAVLDANPEKAVEAKTNLKLIQWFVGQTLKANKGMSPALVKEVLERKINE